jgi:Ser/Thr protein kinase RdoA (MazF antagonist)
MEDEVVSNILRRYGLPGGRLLAMQKGYRNESHPVELPDGTRRNLILYKSEPGILGKVRCANRTADYLAAQGMPARRTADPRIIQLRSGGRVKYGSLYVYLPGGTIAWEAYTMGHLKLLGKTMSDMHQLLKSLPATNVPAVAEEYKQILLRMQRYFADASVASAMRQKLGLAIQQEDLLYYSRLLEQAAKLPGHMLHMDFVRGNILFGESEGQPVVTGILDFEKTAYGHPAFDIARTLAFLLVDCKYKPAEKVRKYFLASGYQKRGAAAFEDVHIKGLSQTLLGSLVSLFLLHDFYKFLRHNPYESLHENEHFMRTRDILVAANKLKVLA